MYLIIKMQSISKIAKTKKVQEMTKDFANKICVYVKHMIYKNVDQNKNKKNAKGSILTID